MRGRNSKLFPFSKKTESKMATTTKSSKVAQQKNSRGSEEHAAAPQAKPSSKLNIKKWSQRRQSQKSATVASTTSVTPASTPASTPAPVVNDTPPVTNPPANLKPVKASDPLLAGLTQEQIYHQSLITQYDQSEDTLRKFILLHHNNEQRKVLYRHYIDELDAAIARLTNDDLKKLANDVRDQVKFAHKNFLQKYDDYKVDDLKLFEVLHATAKLVTTYIDTAGDVTNEDFMLNAQKFSGVMHGIKSDGQSDALKCAGYALLTGLVLAAGVLITVLTFGAFAVYELTFSVIAFGLINMGSEFGFGIYTGMKTVGFFNQAYRELKMANRMEALSNAINAGVPQAESESESAVSTPRV